MSGMIVFDLHIVGIAGTEIARCYNTLPCSTCSTRWSASLKWHQKSGPSSMASMLYYTMHTQWGQIWCDQQDFPITGVSFLYILAIPHTWPIFLRPDFRHQLNGVLRFVLQVLRGNIQWHLAMSVPLITSHPWLVDLPLHATFWTTWPFGPFRKSVPTICHVPRLGNLSWLQLDFLGRHY